MANLLLDPSLWVDDAGHTPPSYWNGSQYVFNSGPSGGPVQYIELIATASSGDYVEATMDNLVAVPGSTLNTQVVQMIDLNGSPSSPYYQNGTDMASVGSWTINTGALNGGEKIQIIGNSQNLSFYAYDFTLTATQPPPIPTPPYVRLRWSDDGGHNFSNSQYQSIGATGQTAYRVLFRRIGSTRRNSGLDRIFELSSDAMVQVCLVGASLNE